MDNPSTSTEGSELAAVIDDEVLHHPCSEAHKSDSHDDGEPVREDGADAA
jgi:hypothetical protein